MKKCIIPYGVIEKSSKQKILLTFENLTFKHLVLNDINIFAVSAGEKLITVKKLWEKLESLRFIVCKSHSLIHSKYLHFGSILAKATG